MPQDSTSLKNQMLGLKDQLGTGLDQSSVNQQLLSKVDFFRPQYQALRGAEADAYSTPASSFAAFQQQYPNVQAGPSYMNQLQGVLGDIGHKYATAATLGDVINTQGGRINDIAGSIVNADNLRRQGIQDQIGILSPLYSAALNSEEAARSRQAQQSTTDAYNKLFNQNTAGTLKNAFPIGSIVGNKAVIGYDANGNPIWGDVVPKSAPMSTDGSITPQTIAAAKPSPQVSYGGLNANLLSGLDLGSKNITAKPNVNIGIGSGNGYTQTGGYINR